MASPCLIEGLHHDRACFTELVILKTVSVIGAAATRKSSLSSIAILSQAERRDDNVDIGSAFCHHLFGHHPRQRNPLMISEDMLDLLKELESIKTSQKALAKKEEQCKADILELMKEEGSENYDSPYGTIRLQRRNEKDYGNEIRSMEIALKEAKKLADDMGDFSVLSVKESLVFTFPKEVF
jgi:hypothetical protein